MAHYQYVAFYRPEEEMKNTSSVNQDSLLKADGIIYGG